MHCLSHNNYNFNFNINISHFNICLLVMLPVLPLDVTNHIHMFVPSMNKDEQPRIMLYAWCLTWNSTSYWWCCTSPNNISPKEKKIESNGFHHLPETFNWILLNHNSGLRFIHIMSFAVYVVAWNECIYGHISNLAQRAALLFHIIDATLLMNIYECLDCPSLAPTRKGRLTCQVLMC